MKLGVIQLFNALHIMGLGGFFEACGVDWRLLYCPFSLNDAMIKNIHLENIGKTFDPGWHFEQCMDFQAFQSEAFQRGDPKHPQNEY